jgi:hypothetical protein
MFGFTTAGFALILVNENTGRYDVSVWRFPMIAFMFMLGAMAFFALLLGRRRKFAFYITAGCLGGWVLRGIQSSFGWLAYHLEHRDEVAENGLPYYITTPIAVGLIAWLFARFVFGQPSRRYFGFSYVDDSEELSS